MNSVRLAMVGAGNIAVHHLKVLKAMPNVDVVGITSRTFDKAQVLAKQFNIKIVAQNIKELMRDAAPDALLILVSIDQMYAVAKKVLVYRLPLFIEKPAGLTPSANQELADLAHQLGVTTMVGFNRRFYSIFHQGLKIIKDNGPLLGVAIEGHERFWLKRQDQNRKFSEDILQQWIFANSTHTIDLLRFFGGEVEAISAFKACLHESQGDQFAAAMRFKEGALGTYNAYWYSPGGWKAALYGEGVTVEFFPLEQGRWIDKNFKSHDLLADEMDRKFKPGFYGQMKAFVDLVTTGQHQWPMLDLQGSYETMRLAEQMIEGRK